MMSSRVVAGIFGVAAAISSAPQGSYAQQVQQEVHGKDFLEPACVMMLVEVCLAGLEKEWVRSAATSECRFPPWYPVKGENYCARRDIKERTDTKSFLCYPGSQHWSEGGINRCSMEEIRARKDGAPLWTPATLPWPNVDERRRVYPTAPPSAYQRHEALPICHLFAVQADRPRMAGCLDRTTTVDDTTIVEKRIEERLQERILDTLRRAFPEIKKASEPGK
jgi:hypothetical protein